MILQTLIIPASMRVTVDVGTLTIRAKPPQDKEVSCSHACIIAVTTKPPTHIHNNIVWKEGPSLVHLTLRGEGGGVEGQHSRYMCICITKCSKWKLGHIGGEKMYVSGPSFYETTIHVHNIPMLHDSVYPCYMYMTLCTLNRIFFQCAIVVRPPTPC